MAAVPTRSNYALLMMRRLVEENVWRAVTEVLLKARNASSANVPSLSATQAQITDLVSLLEMFEEATNSLQADTVTSSMVIPAMLGVDSMLAACDTQYNTFKLQQRSALQGRFSDILCKPEYVIATLLDKRFKLMPFESIHYSEHSPEITPVKTVSAIDAQSTLIQQLQSIGKPTAEMSISANSAGELQVATPEAMPKNRSIFAAFKSMSATGTADRSEDTKYLSMPVLPEVDPAHNWSGAREEFPIMGRLARRYVRYNTVIICTYCFCAGKVSCWSYHNHLHLLWCPHP